MGIEGIICPTATIYERPYASILISSISLRPPPPPPHPFMTKGASQVNAPSPTMGHGLTLPPDVSKRKVLPVESSFKLPSPLPSWPSGDGFAKGVIDLGGLEVCQVSSFTKVWASLEGGEDDSGATFFDPSPIPSGFSMLGSYAQPNNRPLFGWVLVARDASTSGSGTLAKPVDYTLVWSSESSNVKQDAGNGYFWLPTPPEGYKAVGLLVTSSSEKPSLDRVRCVRADLTDRCENDAYIWDRDGFGVNGLRPATRGVQAPGVWVGTFVAQANGSPTSSDVVACLKNKQAPSFTPMPSLSQIQAIMQAYSPVIYLHPDEEYLPSSVSWYFDSGALLYAKGNPNPTPIASNGSNLPQGGSNDGGYWIDLPVEEEKEEKVKKGDIPTSKVYLHVKPMLGATFTDMAIWIFYPFNGAAKAKVALVNPSLGRIGEHVGDWEHVTLRVSNFTGELWRVYFSQHSSGTWVDASQLEFHGGNKPVAYSSWHGHANYSKPGLVLQGNSKLGIGIRNDTAKGKDSMDAGERFEVVSAEYLGSAVVEPPWLNYERQWGPKISYDIAKEIDKVAKLLPGNLKTALKKLVESLPAEVFGEEGPTGPKMKREWSMDER